MSRASPSSTCSASVRRYLLQRRRQRLRQDPHALVHTCNIGRGDNLWGFRMMLSGCGLPKGAVGAAAHYTSPNVGFRNFPYPTLLNGPLEVRVPDACVSWWFCPRPSK
ncbi:uncharacterized protein LOC119581244, partial [Penaeus monodon]|uniref:uncharacterized protein LOC119581244 n=1 Tax=Penaeus monodon TaxID=6687 RepID=UPI0018A7CB79